MEGALVLLNTVQSRYLPSICSLNLQKAEIALLGYALQARSITKRMSKKDANSFLKAVRKFGRIERMADIAEEVGSVLKDQSAAARSDIYLSFIPSSMVVQSLLFCVRDVSAFSQWSMRLYLFIPVSH